MGIDLSWQTVISAGAVVGAVVALVTYFAKIVRWVDKQKQQDIEIASAKKLHAADVEAIRKEQTIIVYGLLACLKGLKEQGCNGPVTEAINRLEKYLNKEAHKQ